MKAQTYATLHILKQKYPNNRIVFFKGNFYIL